MNKIFFLFFFSAFMANAQDLVKRGNGLLEYGVFGWDLYTLTLYAPKEATENQILNGPVSSRMEIKYERNIAKKYLNMGWETGLKDNLGSDFEKYKTQYQWLLDNTHDVKDGDLLLITIKRPDELVTLNFNGKDTASKKDAELAKIILLPWIGPKAVNDKLKKKLLISN